MKLKDAILTKSSTDDLIELCYSDFLNNFDIKQANSLYNLLKHLEPTKRNLEILKVLELIKFPAKKNFSVNSKI